MTTRIKTEEDVMLEDDTPATHKRQRLSSPELEEKPLVEEAIGGREDENETFGTPNHDEVDSVVFPSVRVKREPEDQAQSSSSRYSLDAVAAEDARTDQNDGRTSVGRSTSHNDHIGDGEEGSIGSMEEIKQDKANAFATTANTSRGDGHVQSGSPRWSVADEKALVEFVSRDEALLAWATGRRSKDKGVLESLDQFLKLTPASTRHLTFEKLRLWRCLHRSFLNRLTTAGSSTCVSAWSNEKDRQLLSNIERDPRHTWQWLRLWHDTIHLGVVTTAAKDTAAATTSAAATADAATIDTAQTFNTATAMGDTAAGRSVFTFGPSSHEEPRAAVPHLFQARAVYPDTSNFRFSFRPSSNDTPRVNSSSINNAFSPRSSDSPCATSSSVHAFSLPAQGSSSSPSSTVLAALESRLEQLERQNSMLQAENKQQQEQLNQQRSLMERQHSSLQAENKEQRQMLEQQKSLIERHNLLLQAENKEQRQMLDEQRSLMEHQTQQIERLEEQIERQDQQNERQDQQMERLEQQNERSEQHIERLEQTAQKQAHALDRNALALERRAQAAEREAQKLERLVQRIDRQLQ